MSWRRKLAAAAAGAVALGVAASAWLGRPISKAVGSENYHVMVADGSDLADFAELRVFFAHQSVGGNMIDALPSVYAAAGMDSSDMRILALDESRAVSGPALLHTFVGQNGDPMGKLAEFERLIRSGTLGTIDVAVVKFCYVDLHSGDDPTELFQAYRETLSALERDYPETVFLHMTVPLTVEPGGFLDRAKVRVKDLLGREVLNLPADNVVRERYNEMIRAEYGPAGQLFDIAAVQSTSTSGVRTVRRVGGNRYFAMEGELSSDPGHLNAAGATSATSAFIAAIVGALK